jgi:two-component system, cell cycle response regulator
VAWVSDKDDKKTSTKDQNTRTVTTVPWLANDFQSPPVSTGLEDTNKAPSIDTQNRTLAAWDKDKTYCLVIISGNDIGRLIRLEKSSLVIGRSPDVDLVIDDQSISRQHARITLQDNHTAKIEDLQSKNGTIINNDRIVQASNLKPGDVIQLGSGAKVRFDLLDQMQIKFLSNLYDSAARDPLTNLYNKRSFMDLLAKEISWHKRQDKPFTLISFDVDHFKRINDSYGHMCGDFTLKQISNRCIELSREEDFLGRLGGDEFACALRSTDLKGGLAVAERLRSCISRDPILISASQTTQAISVTISVGVVSRSNEELTSAQALMQAVDSCLYAAKQLGRNRVSAEPLAMEDKPKKEEE